MQSPLHDPALYLDPLRTFLPCFFKHIITQYKRDGQEETLPSPEFHQEIVDVLKGQSPRTVIISPRGSAKSSLISFMWIMYVSMYGLSPFTILISDSHKKAVSFLSRIKRELEGNRFLREVFDIRLGTPWSQDDIVFYLGWLNNLRVRIVARGTGQSLRGYVDDVRPTLVVCDDIETDENCATEDKRSKIRDWFWTGVIPAIDPHIGRVIVVGTIIHQDSLLSRFLDNTPDNWIIKKYSILKEDGSPLWPERFSAEDIQRIKDEYIKQGMLHRFYQEYMNDVSGGELSAFNVSKIRWYNPFELNNLYLRNYMAVDFGASIEAGADYSVIMVGGVSDSGDIYIREYVRDRMMPHEILDTMFNLYSKYSCLELGLETCGPQKAYVYMLNEACRSRGHYLRIREIRHRIPKEQRIMAIQPVLESGRLYTLATMRELSDELKVFPRGKHDDVSDCLGNLLIVLAENKATTPRNRYSYEENVNTPNLFMP